MLCLVSLLFCVFWFVFPQIFVFLFYHLKIFQKCLSCCKLDRPGLQALVDAYQGCFKNSASDNVERRYFAGIYLVFRLYIGVLFFSIFIAPIVATSTLHNNTSSRLNASPILIIEGSWSFLLAGLILLLRPYKKTAHNVIDFFLLFFMTLIAVMSYVSYDFSSVVGHVLVYAPASVLLFYLIYKLFRLCCTCCKCTHKKSLQLLTPEQPLINDDEQLENSVQRDLNAPILVPAVTHTSLVLSDYAADDTFADRLLNPAGYKEVHCTRYQTIETAPLTNEHQDES